MHATPLRAQGTTGDTLYLSLPQVLSLAGAGYPISRASAALVSAAQARAAALRLYENPRLEVDRTTLKELDNLRLMQSIRWPGEGRALGALGRAQVALSHAKATEQQFTFALELAQRYTDALRQARMAGLAIEAESLAQRAVDRATAARRLVQTGDLTVLEVQVSLDAARRARRTAQSEREASAASLAILLGEVPERPIVFEDDLAGLAPLQSSDSLLPQALTQDPESARLQSEAEEASRAVDLAHTRRWPQLELGPAVTIGESTTAGLAFGLSLPLWNRQAAAIEAAKADKDVALAQLEARRRELTAAVLNARTTLARTDEELVLLRGGELARAQQAAALASGALERGGPYLSAWLTARQAYLDARRAELDLEWQAARARLVLRHLTGTLYSAGAP
jgi:outer membrane protein TolC